MSGGDEHIVTLSDTAGNQGCFRAKGSVGEGQAVGRIELSGECRLEVAALATGPCTSRA